MNKVYQEIIDKDNGDSMRASIATMFNLKLHAVPHFLEYGDKWWKILFDFLFENGYKYRGLLHNKNYTRLSCPIAECRKKEGWHFPAIMTPRKLYKKKGVNGLFFASVLSPNYFNLSDGFLKQHAVVIDKDYNIVHDPNKGYEDIIQYPLTSLLKYNGIVKVYLIEPIKI